MRSTSEVLKRSGPDFGEREAVGRSTQDLLKDCQDENDAKIASMSRSERDHELGELESMISPDLLAMLRSRAEKKAAMSSDLKEELRPEAVVQPEPELDDNSGEQPWTQALDNAQGTLGPSTEPALKHRGELYCARNSSHHMLIALFPRCSTQSKVRGRSHAFTSVHLGARDASRRALSELHSSALFPQPSC